jgi:hypothetical protein
VSAQRLPDNGVPRSRCSVAGTGSAAHDPTLDSLRRVLNDGRLVSLATVFTPGEVVIGSSTMTASSLVLRRSTQRR